MKRRDRAQLIDQVALWRQMHDLLGFGLGMETRALGAQPEGRR
jgi:hypothetical protein